MQHNKSSFKREVLASGDKKPQISHLTLYQKELENQEQAKSKVIRKKE